MSLCVYMCDISILFSLLFTKSQAPSSSKKFCALLKSYFLLGIICFKFYEQEGTSYQATCCSIAR